MSHAYTPGLKVTNRSTHRVRRSLPIPGDVMVKVGQKVQADTIVAQTFMPGDVFPLNLANVLSLPPVDAKECLLKKEGERIRIGEPLARTKGIFGFFKNEYKSTVEGTIETVSEVTGQLIVRGEPIPVQVLAYLAGTVVEVLPGEGCIVEADVTFIQGIFGIGGETNGPIKVACASARQELTPELMTPSMKDCIVVGGARITAEAIERAVAVGAAAVIGGGIDDQDLKEFLGYDLGVAITGNETKGITLVITEGFGEIAMADRTHRLLCSREGARASVNGATQIRAGVMRPEVLIPIGADDEVEQAEAMFEAGVLEVGRLLRVIRDPYFGLIGRVAGLPSEPAVLGSGSRARVLEVQFDSGETVVIPRANVELIEG